MRRSLAVMIVALAVACGPAADPAPAGRASRDTDPDGLFHDFLDGKYDGAGHPIGATVYEAETTCGPGGAREAEGWAPPAGATGVVCTVRTGALGAGFVHLPRIERVDDAARARLQTTLTAVVTEAVALRRSR